MAITLLDTAVAQCCAYCWRDILPGDMVIIVPERTAFLHVWCSVAWEEA